MKRLLAMILALVMLLGLVTVSAAGTRSGKTAEDTQLPEVSNPATTGGSAASEDGSMDLMLSVTKTVNCRRTVSVQAKTYVFQSPTETQIVVGVTHQFIESGTVTSNQFVVLSDGSMRYVFTTHHVDSDSYITYYLPSSSASNETIYHTYSRNSSHPHYTYCECGDSYYGTDSSCIQCYPAQIYYYANGGSGAPGSQTVSTESVTLSTTTPKRFPYTLSGWNTESSGSGTAYYAGQSYTLTASQRLNLYANWLEAYTLNQKKIYPEGYGSFPSMSILLNPEKLAEWKAQQDELAKQIITIDDWYLRSITLNAYNGIGYIKFVPDETATYVFESYNSSGDPAGYVYNVNGTVLASNDDGNTGSNSLNFRISYTFTAGNTYYLGVKWIDRSVSGTINTQLRKQYNISYDANGGGAAPDGQTKLCGDTLTLDTRIPAKDGYTFSGWSTTPDGEAQYKAGGTFGLDQDTVLYAVWSDPSGTCGEAVTWRLHDGTLSIDGSGMMDSYDAEDVPWHPYLHLIQNIEIANGVTSIGANAFSGCSLVEQITLPDSAVKIENAAFSGCIALRRMVIPNGVTRIPEEAFWGCTALAEIIIPESIDLIEQGAFEGCASLREVSIPTGVTTLEDNVFKGCGSLENVVLPKDLTRIGAHAFDGCTNLGGPLLPGGITEIGEYAFNGCKAMQELVVPDSVTTIGRAAFANCSVLRLITIPDSVTTIGTSIFAYVKDLVKVRCYIDTPIYDYVVGESIAYELMSWGSLEPPTFFWKAIPGGVSVGITTAKGEVHYTTDGSTPTANSPLYTQEITAQKNILIRAIAVCEGWDDSPVAELDTNIEKVAAPVTSLPSGSKVEAGTRIELRCQTEGATILCTTNGDVPTEADIYTGPIAINEDTTIYAMAVKEGMLNSALAVFTFETGDEESLPVVTTLEATNITENSAKISASVENPESIALVQFVYYEKNNTQRRYTVTADENFSAVLTGLTPGTEYWFQARAVNDAGWNNGYICSFVTEESADTRPTSIEIEPDYISMNIGKSKTLLATVLPMTADTRKVYWSSEEPSVATVSSSGVVTAVGLGTTRIKATTVSGRLAAYCTVNVISTEISGAFDFSEINMAMRCSRYDPNGFDHSVMDGGNAAMSTAYLSRWDGAVLEAADPYPSAPSGAKYHVVDSDYHVQNVLYLPYRKNAKDNDAIKRAVMEYGAVYTSMKVNWAYFADNDTNYYLPENVNTYNGGHAFTIVGWDDNYSRKNFYATPPGDGAFICKNSWGTGSGDGGYFYVSYYDRTLARERSGDYNAVFYHLQGKDNYNKIYQYDYLGPVTLQDMSVRSAYAANVFPAAGSSLDADETLQAVSFYNYAPGTDYEIYIVTDYQNATSLKYLGKAVKSGSLDYAGYFTVELDTPITLAKGTRFAVVVKYISRSDSVKLFVEVPVTGHSSNAKANADESYISSNAKSWTDFTRYLKNSNVCIKAFTNQPNAEDGMLLQGVDNAGRAYEDDTVYTIQELEDIGMLFNPDFVDRMSGSMSLADGSDAQFGSMEPSVMPDLNTNYHYSEGSQLPASYDLRSEGYLTPVRDQGALGTCWTFATYASLESAVMKASATAANRSADGLSQAPSGAMVIELSEDGLILAKGGSAQIVGTLYPLGSGKTILWSSSNSAVAAVSAHGLVYANGTGNATITASTEDGSVSAQCYVTVTAPKALKSVSIENTETELMVGDSLLMEVSYAPSNAAAPDLTWESSNPAVAQIDAYGYLTAKSFGTVEITARYADGTVAATHSLLVRDPHPYLIEVADNTMLREERSISGGISIRAENQTESKTSATVCVVFYSADGQMLHKLMKNVTLKPGDNTVSFANAAWTNAQGGNVLYQVLLIDKSYRPLAASVSDTVSTPVTEVPDAEEWIEP